MKELDLIVYIGRFQPFHKAHLAIVNQAFQQAKFVHIVIGSSNEPATVKNPFSFEERKEMILACFSSEKDKARLSFSANEDWFYDEDRWYHNVLNQVGEIVQKKQLNNEQVGIIGFDKDASSYYIKLFPQWQFVQAQSICDISSTTIRTQWYEKSELTHNDYLPLNVMDYLFTHENVFNPIIKELSNLYCKHKRYVEMWSKSPYPVLFQTVDAYVTRQIFNQTHILLVQRSDNNLFALPGGYLEVDEELIDGAIRELFEETNLDLRPYNKPVSSKRFGFVRRSQFGRLITEVFAFDLHKMLPDFEVDTNCVKAGSDAKDVVWVHLDAVKRSNMHDDHYQMIQEMRKLTN
jgi:bifunctional NMN adenylyltransferase/nudix hydrolase